MQFVAEIDVMPRRELLDPQGKAVFLGLEHLGIQGIGDVRIGKHISLQLEAESEAAAVAQVTAACEQLLANLIMESYAFTVSTLAATEA